VNTYIEAMTLLVTPLKPDWPRDPANNRLLCTPDQPMPKGANGLWSHTNIETVGDDSDFSTGQEFDRRRCKDCGVEWWEEVPQ
jgi:hypothetical protein